MKRREVHIGPGAPSLLLVVVVVGMSVLGLLALMSARSDAKLAARSRSFVEAEYEISARAEETLAALDAVLAQCAGEADYLAAVAARLPEGFEMDGNIISWTEAGALGRSLYCAVEIGEAGATPRCIWREHSFLPAEVEYEQF